MAYKILVPVHSLDEHIADLVNIADNLCQREGSQLMLLHVLPDLEDIDKTECKELIQDARDMLEEFADHLCCATDDIDIRLQLGDPQHEILKCSIAEQVDIIAMPTNGHTGINKLLLGSVAEHIMRHAPCPVVTARKLDNKAGKPNKFEHILLPLDGSPASMQIVPEVIHLAHTHSSRITLFYDEYGTTEDQYETDQGNTARSHIDSVAEALQETGIKVDKQTTRFKNPAEEIARIVDEKHIDLVAMATHGRTGLSRLMFGSVAETCLQNSMCPLLTVSTAPTGSTQYQEENLG